MARLSVGVALLLEYLAPVIIVLWLWAASRKRPRPLTIAGTLLSLGGLVLVLDLTGAVKIDVIGVLWGIAAAVCLAIYFFITAKENDTLPPIVLASGGLMVGAAVMWLAAATGLLPMAFSTADTRLGPWVTPWWVALGGLVVLATVLAYVSGIVAARALGSKVASFVSLTEVLFAVIWAWLLLGELPGSIQLAGRAADCRRRRAGPAGRAPVAPVPAPMRQRWTTRTTASPCPARCEHGHASVRAFAEAGLGWTRCPRATQPECSAFRCSRWPSVPGAEGI